MARLGTGRSSATATSPFTDVDAFYAEYVPAATAGWGTLLDGTFRLIPT
jgi:hypothetical protein